jgi:hypothetical protein
MATSDDTLGRITAEVLTAMPHVAMVMQFRNTDASWRLMGQVTRGADLLEHQLSVNEITREMVVEDITKTRHEYELRQQTVDPASENSFEVALALQAIQECGAKASLVIAHRQTAICQALEAVRTHQNCQPMAEFRCYAIA